MKKKLIAIVASLAMVATMVPASAFAATASAKTVNMSKVEIGVSTPEDIDAIGGGAAKIATYKTTNANVWGTFSDGTLTLEGSVPYMDRSATTAEILKYDSNVEKLQKGHFLSLIVDGLPRINTTNDKFALMFPFEAKSNDATPADPTVYNGSTFIMDGTYNGTQIVDFDVNVDSGKNKTLTFYYLDKTTASGVATLEDGKYVNASVFNKFAEGAGYEFKNLATLQEALKTEGLVSGSAQVTVKTSGLTLLSEAETKSIKGFVDSVKRIDETQEGVAVGSGDPANIDAKDTVDPAYKQATIAARAIYGGLGSKLKEVVDKAVAAKASTELKAAYEALETAEENVTSYDTLTEVAKTVKALPAADKLDLNDAAAVKQVKDAQADVEALAEGVQKVLLDATKNYLTNDEIQNYNRVTDMVNNAAVEAVKKAITGLPTLPTTAFADKAAIDASYAPMTDTEKAYNALTKPQQEDVTNYSDLQKYRTNYDKLIKAYVDPVYAEAAAINLEEALTTENIALITELKDLVEGSYIETKNITKFDQPTYDALIAALNKVEKDGSSLENATIAAITDQAYTGSVIEPAVTVTDKAGNEVAAENYTIIYSNNKDAGTATVTVAAKSSSAYTGSVSATFNITPAALTADMVTVANATYTGKAVKPAVSVKGGVDYTVAYRNNTAVGKASAVVTGTGNYTGTITKNFIVKPAKESIASLKAGKKQITVAYKAQTGAKYRVICKASGLKAIGTNTTATKKTVKKLKSGKTYQVKVRAYKAVDGTTYYGAYSAVKKVKVK